MTKDSIRKTFFTSMLLVTFLSIGLLGGIWIVQEYERFQREADSVRREYICSKKASVKAETEAAVAYIRFKQSETEAHLRHRIRDRVRKVHQLLTAVHENHKGKETPSEIKKALLHLLRSFTLPEKNNYFFSIGFDGRLKAYPPNPQHEGQHFSEGSSTVRKLVTQKMMASLQHSDEAFSYYNWFTPENQKVLAPKISYLMRFKPFNWIIGSGEYLNEEKKYTQQETLNWIRQIRFDTTGYIFVVDDEGRLQANPPLPNKVGERLINVHPPLGAEVWKTIRHGNPEGGFVEYTWINPRTGKLGAKTSYSIKIKEWNWWIGAGVYLDDVNILIQKRSEQMEKRVWGHILSIGALLALLTLFAFYYTTCIAAKIGKGFNSVTQFFERAEKNEIHLDISSLRYKEFEQPARTAMNMLLKRQQAEKALRDSETTLKSILNAAPIGIGLIKDRVFGWSNTQMTRLLGYTPEELDGMPASKLYESDAEYERVGQVKHKQIRETGIGLVETRWIRNDGIVFDLMLSSAYIDPSNPDAGLLYTALDITDRVEAKREKESLEERLRQSEKMQAIGELAGGIAHDFNNQLTGILGYAELLQKQIENVKMGTFAHNIVTAAQRAAELTEQLLAFSRRGKYLSVPVNTHSLIEEVTGLLEHSIDKRINICKNFHADTPITIGDPTQLQNALLNLGINAADAMLNGGTLTFSTETATLDETFCEAHESDMPPGNYIILSITDTGIGMDTETQKHIFEPFFTTKEKGKGTGMGLAAVYGTVKMHQGAISVYSEPNQGSVFRLYLRSSVDRSTSTQNASSVPATNIPTASILVVDDELLVRELSGDILREAGHTVHLCVDGEEAIQYYQEHEAEIDLVLLDMVMPKKNGQETFQAIKEINPDVKAILSSGYSLNGEAQSILDEGALAFVQKPYRSHVLLEAIAAALRKPE